MELLLEGSQVRFGMGGIQEAAVDPVNFSRAPWAVTRVAGFLLDAPRPWKNVKMRS
jgi:hypothetical protein